MLTGFTLRLQRVPILFRLVLGSGWVYWPGLVVTGCLAVYWHARLPSPGIAIGMLGVVAILMAVREKMPDSHKIVWTALSLMLFFAEVRAISKDRREYDEKQTKLREDERANFQRIVDRLNGLLNESQRQFAETVSRFDETTRRSDAIIAGVDKSIKTQTGGDSFAFISFTAQQAQSFEMRWNNFVAPKGKPYFVVSITSHGQYPLRGAHAIMMDDERRLATMQEYNRHPNGDWMQAINSADTEYQMSYLRPQSAEAPTGQVDVIGLYPMPEADSKRITINFVSPNGYWNEVLHLGRVNGIWHQCLSVAGPTIKQFRHPFIYCDSDWPEGKKLAKQDWVFGKPVTENRGQEPVKKFKVQ